MEEPIDLQGQVHDDVERPPFTTYHSLEQLAANLNRMSAETGVIGDRDCFAWAAGNITATINEWRSAAHEVAGYPGLPSDGFHQIETHLASGNPKTGLKATIPLEHRNDHINKYGESPPHTLSDQGMDQLLALLGVEENADDIRSMLLQSASPDGNALVSKVEIPLVENGVTFTVHETGSEYGKTRRTTLSFSGAVIGDIIDWKKIMEENVT